MKNIKYNVLLVCVIFLSIGVKNVSALSTYMSTSSNYITTGQSVTATVTVQDFFSAKIHIECIGNTSGKTYDDIAQSDSGNITRSFSLTCSATSEGTIAFSYSVEALDMAYNSKNTSDSRRVIVQKPREKDSNNYLKSLGVKDYTLSPEFNKDTLEYSVTVPSTVDKITLEAALECGYASLTGTGEFEVNEGVNTFEVNVTSETGVGRVYKVTVNVEDENPIEIEIGTSKYTIMKNAKTLEKPTTYEATTVKIKDFDIPAFYSEISKFTLVGAKDTKGSIHYFIYNAEDGTYSLYNENKASEQLLYIEKIGEDIKDGFQKQLKTINGASYEVLVAEKDSSIVLIKAMNIKTGDVHLYQYDEKVGSYIIYNDSLVTSLEEEIQKYKDVIFYFCIALGVSLFLILLLLIFRPKRKKSKKSKEVRNDAVKIEKLEVNETKENTLESKEVVMDKKSKKKKKKEQKVVEVVKEETEEEVKVENLSDSKNKKRTKEDALKQVSDAASIIEEYEKTISLNKDELKKKKQEMEESSVKEEKMYDIFEDDRKKKKR